MFIQLQGPYGILYINVAQITHVQFITVDLTRSYAEIFLTGWKEPVHIEKTVPGYATIEMWCKTLTHQ